MYHLENPFRQPWHEVLAMLAPLLHRRINNSLPLNEWIALVKGSSATRDSNTAKPAQRLVESFEKDFERMTGRDVKLGMSNCFKPSSSLRCVERIPNSLLAAYFDYWKGDEFFKK